MDGSNEAHTWPSSGINTPSANKELTSAQSINPQNYFCHHLWLCCSARKHKYLIGNLSRIRYLCLFVKDLLQDVHQLVHKNVFVCMTYALHWKSFVIFWNAINVQIFFRFQIIIQSKYNPSHELKKSACLVLLFFFVFMSGSICFFLIFGQLHNIIHRLFPFWMVGLVLITNFPMPGKISNFWSFGTFFIIDVHTLFISFCIWLYFSMSYFVQPVHSFFT